MRNQRRRLTRSQIITSVITVLVLALASLWLSGKLPFDNAGGNELSYDSSSVHFIDVGQGDCTLIYSQGDAVLIDTGTPDSAATVDYLAGLGIDKLDKIIITHPHDDHYGGLSAMLRTFEVGEVVYMRDTEPKDDDGAIALLDDICYDVTVKQPTIGSAFELGDFTITYLFCDTDAADVNDRSIIVRAECFGRSFIVMGDAESKVEEQLLTSDCDISATVLKAGHHGSSGSLSRGFVSAVAPEYVVFSCGRGNSYGHPHKSALKSADAAGAHILRTDTQGSIVFTVTEQSLLLDTVA
jgi:competence protein ComEC